MVHIAFVMPQAAASVIVPGEWGRLLETGSLSIGLAGLELTVRTTCLSLASGVKGEHHHTYFSCCSWLGGPFPMWSHLNLLFQSDVRTQGCCEERAMWSVQPVQSYQYEYLFVKELLYSDVLCFYLVPFLIVLCQQRLLDICFVPRAVIQCWVTLLFSVSFIPETFIWLLGLSNAPSFLQGRDFCVWGCLALVLYFQTLKHCRVFRAHFVQFLNHLKSQHQVILKNSPGFFHWTVELETVISALSPSIATELLLLLGPLS